MPQLWPTNVAKAKHGEPARASFDEHEEQHRDEGLCHDQDLSDRGVRREGIECGSRGARPRTHPQDRSSRPHEHNDEKHELDETHEGQRPRERAARVLAGVRYVRGRTLHPMGRLALHVNHRRDAEKDRHHDDQPLSSRRERRLHATRPIENALRLPSSRGRPR